MEKHGKRKMRKQQNSTVSPPRSFFSLSPCVFYRRSFHFQLRKKKMRRRQRGLNSRARSSDVQPFPTSPGTTFFYLCPAAAFTILARPHHVILAYLLFFSTRKFFLSLFSPSSITISKTIDHCVLQIASLITKKWPNSLSFLLALVSFTPLKERTRETCSITHLFTFYLG